MVSFTEREDKIRIISYGKLFDGPEKVLSWDNFLWLNRSVLLP